MCSTLTRLPWCSMMWSGAFLAALRALFVLRVEHPASSLLCVPLSHKCNEASFFVLRVCAALLPHVCSSSTAALSEHSPTIDAAVGFEPPPRERRRFGCGPVDIFLVADSLRFVAYISEERHKQELLMLVLRRGALGCVTPPQLREEIQGEDDQPFLFHMRRLGSQRLDSIALALKCTCPSGADLISWPSSGNLCVRACFPSHAGLFRSDSFLTSAKHRKAFLRWPRVWAGRVIVSRAGRAIIQFLNFCDEPRARAEPIAEPSRVRVVSLPNQPTTIVNRKQSSR